jgi:hypothetical protein
MPPMSWASTRSTEPQDFLEGFDPLGGDFLRGVFVMAVAGGEPAAHGREAAHAAVLFVDLPLISMTSPGASVQPAKMPPQITACERVRALTMSPDLVMPPSARMETFFLRRAGTDVERGHLRDAHAGDDARGADGAGPLADLDGIGAALREVFHAGGAGDVAGDDGQFGESASRNTRTVSPTPLLKPCAVETATTSSRVRRGRRRDSRMRSRSSSPKALRVAETARRKPGGNGESRAGLNARWRSWVMRSTSLR